MLKLAVSLFNYQLMMLDFQIHNPNFSQNYTNMKKSYGAILIVFSIFFFSYCSSTKKTSSQQPRSELIYYDTHIVSLLEAKCSPCHLPAKGGKKEAFDTYEQTKNHINDIITRIQLNPGEKGFMPFKHPKLSDSAIDVFKQWKADGLLKSK